MVSPDVVGIGSEYFVVYFRMYMHIRLIMSGYLFLYIYFNVVVYHMLSKMRSSGITYKVIGEVFVLGLLVVVYKIPYSSCM